MPRASQVATSKQDAGPLRLRVLLSGGEPGVEAIGMEVGSRVGLEGETGELEGLIAGADCTLRLGEAFGEPRMRAALRHLREYRKPHIDMVINGWRAAQQVRGEIRSVADFIRKQNPERLCVVGDTFDSGDVRLPGAIELFFACLFSELGMQKTKEQDAEPDTE